MFLNGGYDESLGMWLVNAGWLAAKSAVGQFSILLGSCGFGMKLGCEDFARDS